MGIIKKRGGNRMEEDAPRNTYLTKDEHWLAISASSNQTFKRLVQAIKRPELAEDTRFRNNPDRVKNVEELDKIIGDWIASKSLKEKEEIFKYYDVVAGPVYDIEDIFKDIQIKARENIVSIKDSNLNEAKVQSVVPRFSKNPGKVNHLGLKRGEHNEEVYHNTLGLSIEEIESLKQKKII